MTARCMWCSKHAIEIKPLRFFCILTNEEYGSDYWCANFEWHPSFAFMGELSSIAEPLLQCNEINKVVIV